MEIVVDWLPGALGESQSRPAKTALGLAEAFAHRIAAGDFHEGDILPSCRDVARDLHVDKNTVNKAYRLLQKMGIVRGAPGRGVIVVQRARAQRPDEQVRQGIDAIVWRARALGMEEDNLWQIVGDAIGRFYGLTKVRVAFMECNIYEVEHFGRQLEEQLRQPVGRVMLSDFVAQPQRFSDIYDLLVTADNHLATALVAAGAAQHKILGVHLTPIMGDVLRVAAIQQGRKTAVISTAEPTISLVHNLVRTYNPNMEIIPCLASDAPALQRALAQADLIVDTATSHEHVLAMAPSVPIITVTFEMDVPSLSSVKNRITELMRTRLELTQKAPADPVGGNGHG